MKTFHDSKPNGKPTSRMVQGKGGNSKPTVGAAGWLVIAIAAVMVIYLVSNS